MVGRLISMNEVKELRLSESAVLKTEGLGSENRLFEASDFFITATGFDLVAAGNDTYKRKHVLQAEHVTIVDTVKDHGVECFG